MKLFVRFFLLLSFLLLSREGFMYADAYNEYNSFGLNIAVAQPVNSSVYSTATPTTFNYSLPGKERKINKIFLTEDEDEDDDEVSYFRKYTKNSNYFTSFYGHTSRYSCSSSGTLLPNCDNFAYISYDRYILFRSIRI